MQNRIFSTDSPKAVKAESYGYLNAIHYLAPATLAGVGDVCPHRTSACTAACLGWFSGQASMVKDLDHDMNSVRRSRIEKTRRFMRDRNGYMADVVRSIDMLDRRAYHRGKKLCVRMNGSSDIAWEGIRNAQGKTIFDLFPRVQFVDYTKNPNRFDRVLPKNYHLTFSRSENNEAKAIELLQRGANVAVVFAGAKPITWNGFHVIDGDKHDLRHLDPKGGARVSNGEWLGHFPGYVIGLSPKGSRAKNDTSGFVVR